MIDELYIFDYALSESELAQLHQNKLKQILTKKPFNVLDWSELDAHDPILEGHSLLLDRKLFCC